ncbi:hypothetical protein [Nocardia cyriacigeorgica]|uniref:Uncharacterized protein n=1 Tax=Nocardia cyriacigeorgica TaxID=135487 RepID=A0A5R8NFK2_9NOCA|nr:hypothetical protein [Nocardia cyriacigeorgica]TLF74501.1 hypothetical protein FEK34_24385 [Nocardia cyriacigeorgica]
MNFVLPDHDDTGLVEIVAPGVEWAVWAGLVDRLLADGYSVTLEQDGTPIAPTIERELFATSFDAGYCLTVGFRQQVWSSALFSETCVEFQGDSSMISTSEDIDAVVNFMRLVRDVAGVKVLLVPETISLSIAKPYFVVDVED